jgi:hypothetical protein
MPETPCEPLMKCWPGPHVGEEGLEVAIRVEVHVLDLTAAEDGSVEGAGLGGLVACWGMDPLGWTDGRRSADQGRLGQRNRLRAIS